MGQGQSHSKSGTGMAATENTPSVPGEQPPIPVPVPVPVPVRVHVPTTYHAQDLRAIHPEASNTPSQLTLSGDAQIGEQDCDMSRDGKRASKDSGVSGVTGGPIMHMYDGPLDTHGSATTLRTGQCCSREVDVGKHSEKTPPGLSLAKPSMDSSSLVSNGGGIRLSLSNDDEDKKDQPQLEVGPHENLVRSPLTNEPVFRKLVNRERTALRIYCPLLVGALQGLAIYHTGSRDEQSLSPPATLDEPYEMLFYNRKKLQDVLRGNAGHHVKLLLDFMEKERPSTWDKLGEIENGICIKIAFEDLWLLYPPGTTVFKKDDGGWRAYKIGRVDIGTSTELDALSIHAYYLDFDKTGQRLAPQLEMLSVARYMSELPITSLEFVPDGYIHRVCDHASLYTKLVDRGTKYWCYRNQPVYQEYKGDAWAKTSQNDSTRVIIDYATSSKHERNANQTVPRVRGSSCSDCLGIALGLSSYPEGVQHDPETCLKGSSVRTSEKTNENVLLFCPSRIWAFSLKHKTWEMVQPQHLHDVSRQEKAFNRLWLKQEHKDILRSILCTYRKGRQESSSDIIAGKGLGINILLSGGPGTGKTLTAECLAEAHGVPLYMVTCGDMGTDPDTLEQRLHETFLRAANWKAILLLDEADVFVTKRDRRLDVKRGALVSIFLRNLEYSEGLLFLTSNLPYNLDEALEPRIHVGLELPVFTIEAQKSVWLNFIESLEGLETTERLALEGFIKHNLETLDGGAYTNMNGRQIRNCMSAALALAGGQGSNRSSEGRLNSHHIETILRLGKEFREYLNKQSNVSVKVGII